VKNYFTQLLNRHRVNDVTQTEIHTAEPSVPDPSPFTVETATAEMERYKLPGTDQISAELIQERGETLRSDVHKPINFL
jgi:hypothetical protein